MIGLDTNVVVRWLAADRSDEAQYTSAVLLLQDAEEEIFIHDIVLAETVWVLTARYRFTRLAVVAGLRSILSHPNVRVSNMAMIVAAMDAYELGGAGLSDRFIGALNRAQGCSTTLTFDKAASKGPDFTQVA